MSQRILPGVRHARGAGLIIAIALISIVGAACSGSAASQPPADQVNGATSTPGGYLYGPTSTPQPGGAQTGDLCSVWTQAQIDGVMGGSIGAGVPQNDGQMCLWQNDTVGQASISIDTSSSSYTDACTSSDPTMLKVDGVGDGACYLVAGALATMLDFKKGAYSFTVAVVFPQGTVDKVEAAEKALALDAMAKL